MRNNIRVFGKIIGIALSALGVGKATEKALEAKRRKMAMEDSLSRANGGRKEFNDEKDR